MADPFIARLLKPDHVILDLAATEKDGVVRELAHAVLELKSRPTERDLFVSAVLDRERMHSTGMGDGVALPHARNQQASILPMPVIVFGRTNRGIHFGAVDNKPVHLFFLLSAPAMTQHLQMLATLSRLLRQVNLRQELLKAGEARKIIELIAEAERNLGK